VPSTFARTCLTTGLSSVAVWSVTLTGTSYRRVED
jgi:hypothetical protein